MRSERIYRRERRVSVLEELLSLVRAILEVVNDCY
jgi:hypothetical protein